jgi:SsrA-binding protein
MNTGTVTPIASNRRARRDYFVLDTVEAGLVLQGSEVKSLRLGHVQLADAFARWSDGELWLEGVHIAPYVFANGVGAHDPERRRKLLLHRDEIDRLQSRIALERLALVGLARGRHKADKRQALAERDSQREIDRALGRERKGRD